MFILIKHWIYMPTLPLYIVHSTFNVAHSFCETIWNILRSLFLTWVNSIIMILLKIQTTKTQMETATKTESLIEMGQLLLLQNLICWNKCPGLLSTSIEQFHIWNLKPWFLHSAYRYCMFYCFRNILNLFTN